MKENKENKENNTKLTPYQLGQWVLTSEDFLKAEGVELKVLPHLETNNELFRSATLNKRFNDGILQHQNDMIYDLPTEELEQLTPSEIDRMLKNNQLVLTERNKEYFAKNIELIISKMNISNIPFEMIPTEQYPLVVKNNPNLEYILLRGVDTFEDFEKYLDIAVKHVESNEKFTKNNANMFYQSLLSVFPEDDQLNRLIMNKILDDDYVVINDEITKEFVAITGYNIVEYCEEHDACGCWITGITKKYPELGSKLSRLLSGHKDDVKEMIITGQLTEEVLKSDDFTREMMVLLKSDDVSENLAAIMTVLGLRPEESKEKIKSIANSLAKKENIDELQKFIIDKMESISNDKKNN